MSFLEQDTSKQYCLLKNTKMGISICDMETNNIQFLNNSFLDIFEKNNEELIGKSIEIVFPSSNNIFLKEFYNPLNSKMGEFSFTMTYTKRNGIEIELFIHFSLIKNDLKGKSGIVVIHVVELTKNKCLRNELLTLTENLPGFAFKYQLHEPTSQEKFLYLSKGILDIYGIDINKVKNDVSIIRRMIHPDDISLFEDAIKKSSNTLEPFHQVFRINHLEKGLLWLETKAIPQKNIKDETIVWHGITFDITEKKIQEELLVSKEKELQSITENLPDNVVRFDKDGRYLYLNSTMEKTLGMKSSFVIGKKIEDIVPTHKEVIKAIKEIQNCENNSLSIRQVLETESGEIQTHHIKLIAEKNNKGEIVSILAVGRDITEITNIQKELKESIEFSQGVINAIPDLLFEVDEEGKYFNFWSNDEKLVLEYKKTLFGKKVSDILSIESSKVVYSAIKEAKEKGSSFGKVYSLKYITGTKWFELSVSFKKTTNTFLALARDITRRKEMENEILKQKDFQDTLLKSIAKAGMSVNVIEEGKYIYTNNLELAKEYGYDEILSKKRKDFLESIHPDDKEKVALMYKKRLAGEIVPNTYSIGQVNNKGERREHEVSVVLIPNTNPIQTLVVTKDITEQKNIEKRIEFMAHHDILTGLPNRLLLKDRTNQIIANARRFNKRVALLFIDLDGFKTINDSLGHSIGDVVLKMVSQRLQSCIRACDTLSRQGGDEFILILSDINELYEVSAIANKLLKQFDKVFDVKNQHLSTTSSIGIAIYPEHGTTFEELLQNADAAMYKAKENGKNTYCFFTQQMKHNQIGIFKMQNDLKKAISNKEFILHYQPQIDLKEKRIIGAEALIRWEHPLLGIIPPMNFISIAESSGLIVQIGEWVMHEACKQASVWNNQGKNIVVAVNVSAIQFKRGNLIDVVKNALKDSGLAPKYLELELTESILISDTENVLRTVKAIKELGVLLSIDDFGTGYSSLSYLKRFSVDKLKIDQSFVRDIVKDKDDATVVKTIIQMAKSFNLKSIAEGVENEAVLDVLHEFGCDEVQGYHFSKPMIVEEFENYYNNNFSRI